MTRILPRGSAERAGTDMAVWNALRVWALAGAVHAVALLVAMIVFVEFEAPLPRPGPVIQIRLSTPRLSGESWKGGREPSRRCSTLDDAQEEAVNEVLRGIPGYDPSGGIRDAQPCSGCSRPWHGG